MANLTGNNPPSPPQTGPWLIPLPIPLHQFPSISCMAQISPFFPRLFKLPSIFPASPLQGFTPPPGFASTLTTPYAFINNYGAYRFAQSSCGIYGAGGSCFVGPYGYLYLPPIQFQLKVYGRSQTGTSMGQQEQRNRSWPSRPRIVELESRGTGVFHPPDANHVPRNKKRRRKRGKRNENEGVEETGEGSTRSREVEGLLELQQGEKEWRQSQPDDYDVVLPSEWPY